MLLCAPLARSYCSIPFAWCVVLLLFLDLLLCSFCSTCCSTHLAQLVVQLLLFDLLFCSSCRTWHSALFTWPVVLLLLLDLILSSFYLTYCFAPLVQHVLCSFYLTSYSCTSLLHPWFCCSLLLLFNATTLAPFISNWYFPTLYFFVGLNSLVSPYSSKF